MHYCTAKIRLSGDLRNVVSRGHHNPISWPEIEILRVLHGDDSVIDVTPFVRVEQSVKDEKERLRFKYGNDVVEQVFPGRNPQMELEAPRTSLPEATPDWKNPVETEPTPGAPVEAKLSAAIDSKRRVVGAAN